MINISADKHSATSEQTPAPEYVGLRFTKTTPFFGRQQGAFSLWNTEPSEPWQPVSPDFEPLEAGFRRENRARQKFKKTLVFPKQMFSSRYTSNSSGRFALI